MQAHLTLAELETLVAAGEIDTVLTCIADMQGRLMGKRFLAAHFVNGGHEETHGCNYLLATDLEMSTVQGYRATSWAAGYGDYVHKPDLATLRRAAWLPGTAMVMCDVLDHHGEAVAHAPRAMLKAQVERARALGFEPMMATELEFFLFEEPFAQLRDARYARMTPVVRTNNDYGLFGSTQEEAVMRPLRNALHASGVPVENSKGEAEAGQEELNVHYVTRCRRPTTTPSSSRPPRRWPGRRGARSRSWPSTRPTGRARPRTSTSRSGRTGATPSARRGPSTACRP